MVTRRTALKWTAAAAAGLLLPQAYRRGPMAASGSSTKNGRFFGYVPFTQPLYIPPIATPLKDLTRLGPAPGDYPRGLMRNGRPRLVTGNFADVAHGICTELGLCEEWNGLKSGFSLGNTHEAEYLLVTEETPHRFVPGGPDVPVFTYRDGSKPGGSGTLPGPTFVAEYLAPIVVRNHNALTAGNNSLHHDIETSIHLHGSHGTGHCDGYPDFYVLAGEARDYFYPNIAPKVTDPGTLCAPTVGGEFDTTWIPGTMWYHDHVMDLTGFTVSRGLAGFYLVFDERERELAERGVFPPILGKDVFGNPLDVGLAIQDQRFNADGTLFYDFLDHDGRLGDVFTINGVVQPKMKVERRKYRFRFLNASNARVYEIRLSNRQKMSIVGTDSWLLPRAIEVESFEIAQGQRHDVIIDFRGAGSEVYIENIMAQTDGRKGDGIDPSRRTLLMKLEVSGPNHSESADPRCPHDTVIRGLKGIDPGGQWSPERPEEIVATRRFKFDRSNGAWTINNRLFNPRRADVVPELGYGAERWIFENSSGGWWHPIHTHLEGMQTQRINGRLPRPERRFNCDLVELHGNETAEVFIKFRTFTGPYVFHCHAVEHEDMRMMMVVDPTPGPHGGGYGALDSAGPLDGESPIHSDVSGVVNDCLQLEEEGRIYFDVVGDGARIDGRGVGLHCEFDMTQGGNR